MTTAEEGGCNTSATSANLKPFQYSGLTQSADTQRVYGPTPPNGLKATPVK